MIRLNPYIVQECFFEHIDCAVSRGVRRAHKHLDNPSEDVIIDSVQQELQHTLYEWIRFDTVNEDE